MTGCVIDLESQCMFLYRKQMQLLEDSFAKREERLENLTAVNICTSYSFSYPSLSLLHWFFPCFPQYQFSNIFIIYIFIFIHPIGSNRNIKKFYVQLC